MKADRCAGPPSPCCARGPSSHKLTVRAGALTYVTMFGLVPTLAVAFAMFSAFGGLRAARDALMSRLLDYLAVGVRQQVASYIDQMLRNVHSGAIGATGLVFLIASVFSLLSSIEDVFNDIWGVKRARSYFERLTTYWTAVTVTPTLIVLGISHPTILRRVAPLRWMLDQPGVGQVLFGFLVPWLFVVVGFSFMYWFMISTRIPVSAAAVGGLVGGTLWFAAVHTYAWTTGKDTQRSETMTRKAIWTLAGIVLAGFVMRHQVPEIRRYLNMRRM